MSFKQIFNSLESLFNALFGPKPVIAMIGDSIIANLTTTNTQALLPAPFDKALNLGIHGQTSTQIAARINSIPSSVQTILLEGGGNDVLIALAANNMNSGVIDTVYNNYYYMLNTIPRTKHILLLGIVRIDETLAGVEPNNWFESINSRINTLAPLLPNVTVLVDAQTISMVGQTIDGVHPSTPGYAHLFSKIKM